MGIAYSKDGQEKFTQKEINEILLHFKYTQAWSCLRFVLLTIKDATALNAKTPGSPGYEPLAEHDVRVYMQGKVDIIKTIIGYVDNTELFMKKPQE